MTKDQQSLELLTLRQLRYKASDIGVSLYSRKTKASLIKEILAAQKRTEVDAMSSTAIGADSKFNGQVIDTRIVFLPRDPQWAYVFWEISEIDRQKALSKGASRLCLRLTDVTGVQEGKINSQILQEVTVDSHSTEWYLPIPVSDRDYRVEIGYRFGNNWISLAFSSVARVPSMYPSDQILDQFVPFSLDQSSPNLPLDIEESSGEKQDTVLHERLYQTATKYFRKSRVGSEEFQEYRSQNQSFNDSGSGIWLSGRNESGIGGVAPRKRSFWLAADSELVIYGSTDPSAKLTIAGEEVPLSSEGTFRLQVPFRDGLQNYPIEAKDYLGQQMRNITMQFERVTPTDNTNPNDSVDSEWF